MMHTHTLSVNIVIKQSEFMFDHQGPMKLIGVNDRDSDLFSLNWIKYTIFIRRFSPIRSDAEQLNYWVLIVVPVVQQVW